VSDPVVFGKYTLLRKLAEGGMAEIYLALQTGMGGFGKLLVIKRIKQAHNKDREFIGMFLDEARIAASLSHPNITQIFEVGEIDTIHYIAMEYVHGEDLRSLCRKLAKERRPLPLSHAIAMIAGGCAGLHYAHTKTDLAGRPLEIVHRDVSPQNILISYDGHVKLLDFGIAKAQGRTQETRAGVLKGKLSYMSPEQVRGDRLDARSDIFALGILLYELTTGRRLYKDDSDFKTMQKITEDAPMPPRQIIPGYPERLEEIVLKSLTKRVEDRYESAQAFQSDLEGFARQEGLDISSLALGTFLRDVFRDKLDELARQEELGKPLHQILTERQATESLLISEGSASMARGELNSAFVRKGKKRSRAVWYAIGGVAAAGLGAAVVLGYPRLVGTSQTVAASAPAPLAASQASPAVPASIKIVSDPIGAQVFLKGAPLGVTPLTIEADPSQPLYLRFKHDHYQDEVYDKTPVSGEVFVLFDEPVKAAASEPAVEPTNPQPKTPKTPKTPPVKTPPNPTGRFIDPFTQGKSN
jgi:serine/threonine-protein kinase